MRLLKSALAAVAVGTLALGTLAGCSGQSAAIAAVKTDPAAVEALVTKLGAENFKSDGKGAADMASVAAALPKEVKLSWGAVTFDAASGATVLTDVKLTPADMPQIGLGIAELRLWDFNADFAKARLAGQRLTESGKLARRIQATKISVFGLETLVNQMIGNNGGALVPSPDGPPPPATQPPGVAPPQDDSASFGPKLKNYEISMGKVILDDVQLRPYEALVPKGAMASEMGPLAGQFAAVERSFGVDAIAMYDLVGAFAMSEAGQDMEFGVKMKTSGTRGMRGYDADAGYTRDISFNVATTEGAASGSAPIKFDGKIGLLTTQDTHMDKAFSYILKGEVPPRTETNVFSYGLFQLKDMAFNYGGSEVFALGQFAIDAREFYWLIPTKLKISFDNMSFDIKHLAQLGQSMDAAEGSVDPAAAAAEKAQMDKVMAVLAKNGLTKPSLDFGMGWTWNASSGDGAFDLGFGVDDFMHIDFEYQGGFPSFKAVSDLVPDDAAKANLDAIGKVFEKATTLKQVDMNVSDEGGLAKMFAIASELAPLMSEPGADPSSNPFANASPESIRQIAVGFLNAFADSAKTQLPEAATLLKPIVEFVEKGGKLHFSIKPTTPLQLSTMGDSVMTGGQKSEAQMLKDLNVKVEHTGGAK